MHSNDICNPTNLNNIIRNFDYGTESSSTPSQITLTTIQSADKTRLGQTGEYMYQAIICINQLKSVYQIIIRTCSHLHRFNSYYKHI